MNTIVQLNQTLISKGHAACNKNISYIANNGDNTRSHSRPIWSDKATTKGRSNNKITHTHRSIRRSLETSKKVDALSAVKI